MMQYLRLKISMPAFLQSKFARLPFKHVVLLLAVQCFIATAFCQAVVTGMVTDTTGSPLAGITVESKSPKRTTITDAKGKFSLNLPDMSRTLVFSAVGMVKQEIVLGGRLYLDIVMLFSEATAMQDVVVIGYGSQSRATMTTAVAKLDTKVLENVPFTNPAAAMQGTLPGVRVQSGSGQPGAAPKVIVRGGTSINNPDGSSPLYIIDGVIRDNMNDINSADIENLQVLKDAASTAIYGARGSNGVVIVSTRSGKSGKAKITYGVDLSRSDVGKLYDMVGARDYIYFQRLGLMANAESDPSYYAALAAPSSAGTGNDLTNFTTYTTQYLTPENEYKLNEGWEQMPDPYDPTKTIIFKGTDYQDVTYRTAFSQNHTISASGGNDKATFNASLGYMKAEGTVITTKYDRLTFGLNSDYKVLDNLKVFGRVMYTRASDNQPYNNTQVFLRSSTQPPTSKYTFEDGSLAPGMNSALGNPAYHLNKRINVNSTANLTLVTGAHWSIAPGLSFDPQISLMTRTYDNRFFQLAGLINGVNGYSAARNASAGYTKMTQYQADAVFSYTRTLGSAHNIDVKAGFAYYQNELSDLSASGRGGASDLVTTLNGASTPLAVSGTASNQVIAGYFSRINYNFKQKYLLAVNARYDGASNLGNAHKWGFFPGVSAGWIVDREKFWNALPKDLLTLKLRASYGVNGNISGLGRYQSQGQFSVGMRYNNASAVQNSALANDDLRWEQSKTVDVGADAGFLSNRISLSFDYFRRQTDNLLTSLSLPHSTGFASIITNLGSLENKGIELALSASILPATAQLQWNVSVNATRIKSKILKLPYNGAERNRIGGLYVWDPSKGDYGWLGGLQEGGRVGDLFMYQQTGVYTTDAEAAAGPPDLISNVTRLGGDAKWEDVDKNGVIDDKDRVYAGNIYPVWTGGFTNTLSYKNIELYVRMDYTTGHTIYNFTNMFYLAQLQGDNGLSTGILQSWQKPGDVTNVPRLYWGDPRANHYRGNEGSSVYYEKGDFLAVREITIAYTLPAGWLKKAKISNLRFNLTANNLHYFTNAATKSLNPEEGGTDSGRYPNPRNFIIGARITL